jgi:hypothetical protein
MRAKWMSSFLMRKYHFWNGGSHGLQIERPLWWIRNALHQIYDELLI